MFLVLSIQIVAISTDFQGTSFRIVIVIAVIVVANARNVDPPFELSYVVLKYRPKNTVDCSRRD